MSEHDFIQQFMRLRHDRRGLALQEKADGSCIFLDGNDCSVQPVKPQQCRDFPSLWNFPGFEKTCHAIPRLVSDEDYRYLDANVTLPITRRGGKALNGSNSMTCWPPLTAG